MTPDVKALLRRLPGTQWLAVQRQKFQLALVKRAPCDTTPLSRDIDRGRLGGIFASQQLNDEWPGIARDLASLNITDKADGLNPGDRRALYYLVRFLRPSAMLEIGTCVGASTVHAVAALSQNGRRGNSPAPRFTTVDIRDVNDAELRPWLNSGSPYSPSEMIARLGATDFVTFVTASSTRYLSTCRESYDLIFLDGDHSAGTVYEEIVLALRVLSQGGVIVLHDYFPGLQPLWSDGSVIPGPWLGTQRLRAEGVNLTVLPLGDLPWMTKRQSKATSLAIVVGT
jgi:predicted O-methyltransferase YrrM